MTIPIILIDEDRHIQSGGIFYIAMETEDVYTWILEMIFSILGEKWITLFTDQDSAIICSCSEFLINKNVQHFICSFHKNKNFVKQINLRRLGPKLKEELLVLFQIICNNEDEKIVLDSVQQIETITPELNEYLDREIIPFIHKFTIFGKGFHLTLGYNSTSPSESANHMIKSQIINKRLSLIDLRKNITRVFEKKQNDERY